MSKKTKKTPLYIKSLEMENIRCFGAKQVLSLVRPDGTLSQWTLLLGNNGVGKTTLLQCVTWMRPQFIFSEDSEDPEGMQPALDEEENEVLLSISRSSKAEKRVTSNIWATFCENQNFNEVSDQPSSPL